MYNNTNPAELFSGTTWELVATDKYIKTGNTPLQTGGSNSVSIAKANLPNVKLEVDTVSATIPEHIHGTAGTIAGSYGNDAKRPEDFGGGHSGYPHDSYNRNTKSGGAGNTGSISPSTESLGNGTALTIQPAYITLKLWKRLT